MSSSQLSRLAIAFVVAFLMAPFAQAQSGGQDGPLAFEKDVSVTKGPPKGDRWKPMEREPVTPPGGGPPPDDGTPPDGTTPGGNDDDDDKKDGTSAASGGLAFDGMWVVNRDGSSEIRLSFHAATAGMARLGVELEGHYFELALVPVSSNETTMSFQLNAAQTAALSELRFVLQMVPDSILTPPHDATGSQGQKQGGPQAAATRRSRRN